MKYGHDAVSILLDIFNKYEVPYMIVGSYSSNAYGESRATKDADIVAEFSVLDQINLEELLPPAFVVEEQMSFETISGTMRRILHIPEIPFEIEIFDLTSDEFDQTRFHRKVKSTLMDRLVYLPTPEDVVIQKLRWANTPNREKDFLDARAIIEVRGDRLDWEYIQSWCDKLDLEDILARLRA